MAAEFPVRAKVEDKELDQLIAKLRAAGKAADLTDKEMGQLEKQIRDTGRADRHLNGINKKLGDMSGLLGKAAKGALALWSIDKAKQFLNTTIEITAQFQKFRAILANTLGSDSAGAAAFDRILLFAAKTPFQVSQITDAFIKLANRGFVPTNEELTKMGDLTSAMGKDMDQLVEALLDATTGEFERLKEFGIRAKKSGDQVEFAFKGVKTQVDFTEESIRNYILSLGELEGVAGSMAVVSETLGGKMSNAADAIDRFFAALGENKGGVIEYFIEQFTELTMAITQFIEVANKNPFEDYANKRIQKNIEAFVKLTKEDQVNAINEVVKHIQSYRKELADLEGFYAASKQAKSTDDLKAAAEKFGFSLKQVEIILSDYDFELEHSTALLKIAEESYKAYMKEFNKGSDDVEEQTSILARLNAELAKAKAERDNAITEDQLSKANLRIQLLDAEIKRLMELGRIQKDIVPDLLEKRDPAAEARKFTDAIKKHFGEDFLPDLEKINDDILKDFENTMDDMYKANQERLRKQREAEERARREREEIIRASFMLSDQIAETYAEIERNRSNARLERLEEERREELKKAGDNKAAKERINEEYDEKERAIKARQARREQTLALFSIAINTAEAVVAAIAKSPTTFGLPFSAFAIAMGALQAAAVKSQSIPKYKDGVYDLQGPGTETSDSIPAHLSKRESVVHAKASKRFGWLLKPMIEDKSFSELQLRELVDKHIPTHLRGDIMLTKGGRKGDDITRELRDIKRAIEGKPVSHINVDENGFNVGIQKGQMWTNYVSKRYSA
ncbi:hypothetical protein C900_05357 [Fulvivirga imtechensis AK7]|uniref:Phage tail tape measure protein domain-containing protein n=1 Tax=Fulvivirga imtechensis AK7 TaxID=1237149 RepID=L8JJS6_9BACT|nr:hypothetical protein [Fulvivirga imtechensis]ELR69161.1 hypothetical protein C900_05357 [Fulvivirga imtechensis AK7]